MMARQVTGFDAWSIPQSVSLPRPPALVKFSQPAGEDLGKNALQDMQPGELLHITGGSPDGSALYGIKAATKDRLDNSVYNSGHGWLSRASVQPASPQEVTGVACLPLREHIRRVTLARAIDDWSPEEDFPESLPSLRSGDLMQVGAIRDTWAYGWPLEHPSRRGWFPVALARRLEPMTSSLVGVEMEEELCPSAASALVELIRRAPQPPANAQTSICPPELPPVVAESGRKLQSQWEDKFAQIDSDAQEAAAMAQRTAEGNTAQIHDGINDLFTPELIPDDAYPLYVCRSRFQPPHRRGAAPDKALLPVQNGDLIRVVSALEATMYCGFLEGRPNLKGWFPARCVEQLEDPLTIEADAVPVGHLGIGAPPLPEVPPSVRFRQHGS